MTAKSRQWLLVNTLDPSNCLVVAAGFNSQKNSPLVSFLHARADRSAALGVVGEVIGLRSASWRSISSDRVAYAEPVAGPDNVVHAAWLLVGAADADGPERPPSWAFTWNLDDGTASRGAMDEEADRPALRSIAEALEEIDMSPTMSEVASAVVSGQPSETYRAHAVRRASSGPDRLVRFHGRLGVEDQGRVIRGFSHDVGPLEKLSRPNSIGDIVAATTVNTSQWRALVNLRNLELICWYDSAPTDIGWRYDPEVRHRRIHAEDFPQATAMAADLVADPIACAEGTLRFLTTEGDYCPYRVAATRVAVDNAFVGLVTLTPSM